MKRIKVILNHTAGCGYGAKVESKIRGFLKNEMLDFDLVLTKRAFHAIELAEQAAKSGFEIVVAAGGDGTTNEVVNGLMKASDSGFDAALGIIPLGRGSDFANTVGVSPDLREACSQIAHGQIREVDIGCVKLPGESSRYFDNTLGIGFDGVVTDEARKIKLFRGTLMYLLVVLKTVFVSFKAPSVTIEYDGSKIALRALMICIANGKREGGGFYVAPQAVPDDGFFDLCIVRDMGKMAMLKIIPNFLKGTHLDKEAVTMARAKKVLITSKDDLIAHMDGEMLCTEGNQIECEILPRRLKVWR